MNKSIFPVLLLSLIFIVPPKNIVAQSGSALEYMKQLTTSIEELKSETWQYLKSVTKGKSARVVDKKRQELLSAIKTQKMNAGKIKPYQTDEKLKNAVVNYLDLSYTVLKEDFDKILDMEEIAEQSYDFMEAYLLAKEKANLKLNEAFESLVQAQKDFANTYEIQLIDSEGDKLSQRIGKANETLEYYNDVYLIFFKSYKQEAYVLDAISRQDISAVEQNNNTLASFAKEGIGELNKMKGYNGDAGLKTAAQNVLKFYQKEAEKDFPTMVDFYIKKDNFEKVKKMMDAKSKKDRTQQDIDKFNTAANEFNQAVESYNKTNDSMNKERSKILEGWNKGSDKFFEQHAN